MVSSREENAAVNTYEFDLAASSQPILKTSSSGVTLYCKGKYCFYWSQVSRRNLHCSLRLSIMYQAAGKYWS